MSKALEIKDKLDKIEREAREEDETRVEKLGFTRETVDALRKIGVKTYGSLKRITISWMTDMGLPKTHIDEVRNRMASMGIDVKYKESSKYPNSEESREMLPKKAAVAV